MLCCMELPQHSRAGELPGAAAAQRGGWAAAEGHLHLLVAGAQRADPQLHQHDDVAPLARVHSHPKVADYMGVRGQGPHQRQLHVPGRFAQSTQRGAAADAVPASCSRHVQARVPSALEHSFSCSWPAVAPTCSSTSS